MGALAGQVAQVEAQAVLPTPEKLMQSGWEQQLHCRRLRICQDIQMLQEMLAVLGRTRGIPQMCLDGDTLLGSACLQLSC